VCYRFVLCYLCLYCPDSTGSKEKSTESKRYKSAREENKRVRAREENKRVQVLGKKISEYKSDHRKQRKFQNRIRRKLFEVYQCLWLYLWFSLSSPESENILCKFLFKSGTAFFKGEECNVMISVLCTVSRATRAAVIWTEIRITVKQAFTLTSRFDDAIMPLYKLASLIVTSDPYCHFYFSTGA
jgi:hypothetical protein